MEFTHFMTNITNENPGSLREGSQRVRTHKKETGWNVWHVLPCATVHSQMTIVAESGHGCDEGSRIHGQKYLAGQNKGCGYQQQSPQRRIAQSRPGGDRPITEREARIPRILGNPALDRRWSRLWLVGGGVCFYEAFIDGGVETLIIYVDCSYFEEYVLWQYSSPIGIKQPGVHARHLPGSTIRTSTTAHPQRLTQNIGNSRHQAYPVQMPLHIKQFETWKWMSLGVFGSKDKGIPRTDVILVLCFPVRLNIQHIPIAMDEPLRWSRSLENINLVRTTVQWFGLPVELNSELLFVFRYGNRT